MTISFLLVERDPNSRSRLLDDDDSEGEVTLCNANAVALLGLMGLPQDSFGELSGRELDPVIGRLLRLANSVDARRAGVRSTEIVDGKGVHRLVSNGERILDAEAPPRVVSFGLSDQGIADRAIRLLELFRRAKSSDKAIVWG